MTSTILKTVADLESKLLKYRSREELTGIYHRAKINLDRDDLNVGLGKIAILNFELGRAAGEVGSAKAGGDAWEFFSVGSANAEIEKLESELGHARPGKKIFNIGRANERIFALRREVEKRRGTRPTITPRPTACPAETLPSNRPAAISAVASPARSTPSVPAVARPSLQQIALAVYGASALEVLAKNLRSDEAIDRRLEENLWRDALSFPGQRDLSGYLGPKPELKGFRRIERGERQKKIDKLFAGTAAQTETPKVSRPRPVPKTAAERIREMQGR